VINVAHDNHPQPAHRLFVPQNRVGIEQGLRRMFVHAIAGIDDWNIEVRRHQVRRTGVGMADHNDIRSYCPQRVPGIE
jgi:hypothetical protein